MFGQGVESHPAGEAEEEYEKILEDTIPVTVGSQSWLDRLESVGKSVVTYAAGKIPVIGGVVEKAIDLFWPESDWFAVSSYCVFTC